ncbi:peptidoglycan-binding domain-containing protein [Yoonia litorea]|uniref:Peptidoglycan-binding (PGRP) domain of peptidoglycan hydrolases-containing protein n=1 Tax=Yoonia litorea TaxID=1123755 RepID=A0A1I6MTK4_9RHOB|nr:peptidoglycan-binding domain-containing protein [Yoonia litorea]SFS19043.1 Peptidoglycan-binding (PGRP) domain of peptidoglycan hydrolases-containing protein [Yoonia litorea]
MRKLTLIAALSCLAAPALADDAAVLIGVDRYDDFRRVSGATDLIDTADALRDVGFNVSTLADGSIRDTRRVLEQLADEATDAERLVVGLSGRFATDEDRTWFLTEDSDTPTPFGLDDAISVDTVLDILSRAPGQALLVLGYDQDNFASFGPYLREGVGRLDIPQGVTVVYGAPNRVDDLLDRAVAAEGGDVIAYVQNDRRLNILGYQPGALVLAPEGSEPVAARPTVDPSIAAWNRARAANTADSYRDFIFSFPRSPFASEARERLDDLENDPRRVAEATEDGLNLTRNERREIQDMLTTLGYDTRGVDGIFGPGTRSAIESWQRANAYTPTSFLNQAQIDQMTAQFIRREAEIAEEQEREREQREQQDRAYWDETGANGGAANLRAYLERYPDGIFADQARQALGAVTDNAQAQAREDALNINPTLRRLIESRLAGLGFNPGQIDGRFDRNTRRAIADYQSSRNLTASGYIDQPTLARLLADTFGR